MAILKFKKVKKYLYEKMLRLRNKIQKWLGLNVITNEVNANFIHLNALEEYIKDENDIEKFVEIQCKKYKIKDPENIEQIIKNQKNKNYLAYNNKILPEQLKKIPKN